MRQCSRFQSDQFFIHADEFSKRAKSIAGNAREYQVAYFELLHIRTHLHHFARCIEAQDQWKFELHDGFHRALLNFEINRIQTGAMHFDQHIVGLYNRCGHVPQFNHIIGFAVACANNGFHGKYLFKLLFKKQTLSTPQPALPCFCLRLRVPFFQRFWL